MQVGPALQLCKQREWHSYAITAKLCFTAQAMGDEMINTMKLVLPKQT